MSTYPSTITPPRTRRLATTLMLLMLTINALATRAQSRLSRLRRDSGDVPGWAIASGAACVLALAVYVPYHDVINHWIGNIMSANTD